MIGSDKMNKYEKVFESDNIIYIKLSENLIIEYLKMVNNPAIAKMISKNPIVYTPEQELVWVRKKLNQNALIFSMIERTTGEYIGNIEILSINDNIGLIGISITESKQDRHYGQESLKRIIEYGYEELNLDGFELNVYSTNQRAIHCYEKIGFINVEPQEVCEATYVIIGGKTNIFSSSLNFPLFLFSEKSLNPYVVFLCKSDVILSIDSREFMSGTNKLNFMILHDTKVHLTTGNGFSSESNYEANNVLIDERASSIFIEKNYRTIPMWGIFGTLTVKEDSELQLINSYNNTPGDNYNIHFKGTDCKMFIENPKNLVLYSKNSNVIYTDNLLNFNIKCSRINMWLNSTDISSAGDINDLPNYSWYKESILT